MSMVQLQRLAEIESEGPAGALLSEVRALQAANAKLEVMLHAEKVARAKAEADAASNKAHGQPPLVMYRPASPSLSAAPSATLSANPSAAPSEMPSAPSTTQGIAEQRASDRLQLHLRSATNQTGFRGVSRDGRFYIARFAGHRIGRYQTAEVAARAYAHYRAASGQEVETREDSLAVAKVVIDDVDDGADSFAGRTSERWQSLSTRCAITWAPLTDPARLTGCTHLPLCNFDSLRGVGKVCPVLGCNVANRQRFLERDTQLAQCLRRVHGKAERVFVRKRGSRWELSMDPNAQAAGEARKRARSA